MAIIRMRDHLYDEIVNYAKEHLPEEACGLLAGAETEEGRVFISKTENGRKRI